MSSVCLFQYAVLVNLIVLCGYAQTQGQSKLLPLRTLLGDINHKGAKTVNLCAGVADGDYADIHNPYGYITCRGGQTIRKICPPGKMWDTETKSCVMQLKRSIANQNSFVYL
ncbi:uncharacterized protein LOC111324741 isoform X2 [Stylophora pistillata]|uniref:uncharacterized protein LOC111324741 isoform X2 n=1 Tax=Stylophora pistillata TaxID=50429 RepID=UPI000C050CCF|nr:uncharacterized protein LOC111324741 isoform X2 [Stylophora pistillata]